jgi:hypothetical protein
VSFVKKCVVIIDCQTGNVAWPIQADVDSFFHCTIGSKRIVGAKLYASEMFVDCGLRLLVFFFSIAS